MPTDEQDLATPLYLAAEKGHVETVTYLLTVGADKDIPDRVCLGDVGGLGTCARQQSKKQNMMGVWVMLVGCMYVYVCGHIQDSARLFKRIQARRFSMQVSASNE